MMYLATAVNDHSVMSSLISIYTRSRSYHSELVFSDGYAFCINGKKIEMVHRQYDWYKWHLVPLPMIKEGDEKCIRQDVVEILNTNPKYDWLGAIGGMWCSHLQNPNKWYCSEFCRMELRRFIPELNKDEKWITPDRLLKIVSKHMCEHQNPLDVFKQQ